MRNLIRISAVLVVAAATTAGFALAETPGYAPPVDYTAGNSAYPVTVADFNGDGRLDVATGNEEDDSVSILLGKGKQGKFKENGNYPAGEYPFGSVAGDFVGDSNVDLVVVDYDGDTLALLEGDGTGGFAAPQLLPAGDGPVSVAASDLNGDGNKDLAVADEDTPALSILFAKKKGGFKPAQTTPVSAAYPTSVAIAQFDGKGGKDIGLLDYDAGVDIFRGEGNGDFAAPKTIPVTTTGSYGLAVGQLDGKGRVDIWVSRCEGAGPAANALLLAKGKKGLKYEPQVDRAGGDCTYEPEIKDVDGDGSKDVIETDEDSGEVVVTFNSKKGLKNPKAFPAVDEAYSVASGDFNNDGIRDFAVPDYGNPATAIVLSD